ncbi:MAG: pyrroline-5-carboxylate reductase family protein, partial [Cetobacterium sp.]
MRIGFIGAGNMSGAIIKGIISSGIVKKEDVFAADKFLPTLEKVKTNYGINITEDNKEVVENCDVI